MSTVNLPGVGPVKKPVLLAGVGVTAAILALAYYRRAHGGGSAPAAATPPAADTSGEAIDPSTGLPYSQESAGVGYGQPDYGGYGGYGGYNPGSTYYPTSNNSSNAYTSNSDWEQAAVGDLSNMGISTTTASTALTRVLGGLSVTTTQKGYFQQAVGLLGNPPNGYPTPIHVVDTPSQPSSGSKPGKATGLHTTSISASSARVDWNPVSGATGYHVDVNGARKTSVVYSVYSFTGLKHSTHYTLGVTPFNAHGDGPRSTLSVTTHKK